MCHAPERPLVNALSGRCATTDARTSQFLRSRALIKRLSAPDCSGSVRKQRLAPPVLVPWVMTSRASFDAIPREMAAAATTAFGDMNRDQYIRYLQIAHHQLRNRGAELRHAASILTDLDTKAGLVLRARAEDFHYRLAVADLSTLDATPTPNIPRSVQRYRAYWRGIDGGRVMEWLGAWHAVLSVAPYAERELARAGRRLSLDENTLKFARTHFTGDWPHAQQIHAFCAAQIEAGKGAPIITGAAHALRLWTGMHHRLSASEGAAA